MVCEIALFRYNGATVCIMIDEEFFAPIRKSSPIHFCAYDQNHKSASTSSTFLSHFYRDTDLPASIETA